MLSCKLLLRGLVYTASVTHNVDGEGVNHATIHLVEALNLLRQDFGLIVDVVNRAHLQRDALEV